MLLQEEQTEPQDDHFTPQTPEGNTYTFNTGSETLPVQQAAESVRMAIGQVVVGQTDMLDQMLIALFTGGHILLEGVPGIAKTLTANLLAQTIQSKFSRIQFTPDLMPADVVGTPVFNLKSSEFTFRQGPVFANIILIDEINRAPAKTQSALFEVMEERQVTVDGTTYPMGSPFFVVATQNPIEQEGTYKLPEAQLDRFLFKINMTYPSLGEERQILHRFSEDFEGRIKTKVTPVLTPKQIADIRAIVEKVVVRPELLDYIAAIVYATRDHADLFLGASPRASLSIMKAAKAAAAMSGRNFVTPDDIRSVSYPVLNHRIILTPEREMEGLTSKEIVEALVKSVEVPR
jgi:MoxR-like ATPase